MIKNRIQLTEPENLLALLKKGRHKATNIQKAHVLLASDEAAQRQSETALSRAIIFLSGA